MKKKLQIKENRAFNQVVELIQDNYDGQRELVGKLESDDERLIHLGRWLETLGKAVMIHEHGVGGQRQAARADLARGLAGLASLAFSWLELGDVPAVEEVYGERVRQRALFLMGGIHFDCASPKVNNRRKYRVLFEEAGEVAKALDQLERENTPWNQHQLCTELVQVAAVAVAWLESLTQSQISDLKSQDGKARAGQRSLPGGGG